MREILMSNPLLNEMDQNKDIQNPADFYFDLVCKYAPAIKRSLLDHGHLSLAEYTDQYPLSMGSGFQNREDFFEVVYDYISPLHGSKIARQTINDLLDIPCALTANHHGVDFFAQSVQGSLLFSHILSNKNPGARTIPVFACGNIPLNNLTYPRGLLVYDAPDDNLEKAPQKIPIFSDGMKTGAVSVTGPLDKDHVMRASKRVEKMLRQGTLSAKSAETIHDILETEYADPYVHGLKNYSEQSVILNHRLWKRMHSDSQGAMDLVYMELEKIVNELLFKDFQDPNSLISILMFNPTVRRSLITGLNGKDACWHDDKLEKRLNEDLSDIALKKYLGNCGTHFFWGVDRKNKLVPMYLSGHGHHMVIKGKDQRGNEYSVAFDPASLADALKHNRLLPSLFTSYTALSLARGISCIGGYYQSSYLPVMQKNVVDVMKKTSNFQKVADQICKVKTSNYLSGMQTIMSLTGKHSLLPAGPIEIIAGGGINKDCIDQINRLTVKEAHLASLFETIPDVVPYGSINKGWHKNISDECHAVLGEKIVIL